MTAKQVEKRIREMITSNTMRQNLVDTALRLYKSRGVDASQYENNYILPKMLLCEALRREGLQYEPFIEERKKDLRNLRHF